jgi:hypothetical protein
LVSEQRITLTLSQDEGLVLFEWLTRLNAGHGQVFDDQAEQRVSWDLEAMLEPQISSLLSQEYPERLRHARDSVRDADT